MCVRAPSSVDGVIPGDAVITDPSSLFSNGAGLTALHTLVTRHIATAFVPPPVPSPSPSPAGLPHTPVGWRDSGHGGVLIPPMPARGDGFVSGLPQPYPREDPLFMGGVAGGGLFVGPGSALFREGGGPGLPFGVPPGARFDPFGPNPDDIPGMPGGRGRGRGTLPFGM